MSFDQIQKTHQITGKAQVDNKWDKKLNNIFPIKIKNKQIIQQFFNKLWKTTLKIYKMKVATDVINRL